jgi:hypothetical protein
MPRTNTLACYEDLLIMDLIILFVGKLCSYILLVTVATLGKCIILLNLFEKRNGQARSGKVVGETKC